MLQRYNGHCYKKNIQWDNVCDAIIHYYVETDRGDLPAHVIVRIRVDYVAAIIFISVHSLFHSDFVMLVSYQLHMKQNSDAAK